MVKIYIRTILCIFVNWLKTKMDLTKTNQTVRGQGQKKKINFL